MKRVVKNCLKAAATLVLLVLVSMAEVGTAHAYVTVIHTIELVEEGKKESTKMDIDGDGVMNTLSFSFKGDSEEEYPTGYTQKAYVEVDGQMALEVDVSSYGIYGLQVKLVESDNQYRCMQLWGYTDNDYITYSQIYAYDSGSGGFYKVFDLEDAYGFGGVISWVYEDRLQLEFSLQPIELGWISWESTYIWKDGKLVAESNEGRASGVYTVNKKLKFYKKAGGKTVAFTAKKGDSVYLEGITVKKKKMYAEFYYENQKTGRGKRGWLRINSEDYDKIYKKDKNGNIVNTYFQGVQLAG